MGQRLVIQFRYNGDTYATLYQHWSGYTDSSANTLDILSGVLPDLIGKSLLESKFILQSRCEEFGYFPSHTQNASRNNGLLDFNEKEIEESMDCSNADILIETNLGTIDFQVFGYEDEEDYLEYAGLEKDEIEGTISDLPHVKNNPIELLSYTSKEDILEFANMIYELDDEVYIESEKAILCKITA